MPGDSVWTFNYGSYSYNASSQASHTETAVNVGAGYTITHSLTETDSSSLSQTGSGQTATRSSLGTSTSVNHDHTDFAGSSWDSSSTNTMTTMGPAGSFTLASPEELADPSSNGAVMVALPAAPGTTYLDRSFNAQRSNSSDTETDVWSGTDQRDSHRSQLHSDCQNSTGSLYHFSNTVTSGPPLL